MLEIQAILETCLYVQDLDRAERFYVEVLGLNVLSKHAGRHVFFQLPAQMLLLFDPDATGEPGSDVPPHGSHGPGHVAFRVEHQDLDHWRQRLLGRGVTIEQEIAWPGGGYSIYFRDPSGNSLELATAHLWFPE